MQPESLIGVRSDVDVQKITGASRNPEHGSLLGDEASIPHAEHGVDTELIVPRGAFDTEVSIKLGIRFAPSCFLVTGEGDFSLGGKFLGSYSDRDD